MGLDLPPLDDRQITRRSCVCLKHLLYDFFGGGVLGLLPVVSYITGPRHALRKSYSECLRGTQIR